MNTLSNTDINSTLIIIRPPPPPIRNLIGKLVIHTFIGLHAALRQIRTGCSKNEITNHFKIHIIWIWFYFLIYDTFSMFAHLFSLLCPFLFSFVNQFFSIFFLYPFVNLLTCPPYTNLHICQMHCKKWYVSLTFLMKSVTLILLSK